MVAPLPANELQRLQTLRRHAILDTPPEQAFDRITRLAARLIGAPIALVSLVDRERQWFKSCHGLDLRETPRSVSFCAHAILQETPLLVPDAAADPRFAANPLVTGAPHIRFYAGVPLVSENGSRLGTLCVIDDQPRELEEEHLRLLQELAAIVSDELQLRLTLHERNRLAEAVQATGCGVLMTDPHQEDDPIVYCNGAFTEITGYAAEEVLGQNCRFLQGPATDPQAVTALREGIAARRRVQVLLVNYRRDGTPFCADLTVAPVFAADGRLINYVGVQVDVTEQRRGDETLRASLQRLNLLERVREESMRMLVHNIRSPLSVTRGFLQLLKETAREKLGSEDREAIEMAREGADQIQHLTQLLLHLTRLQKGAYHPAVEWRNLQELVRGMLSEENLGRDAERVFAEFPPGPLFCRCDANLVGLVLQILTRKALALTPPERSVLVQIEGRPEEVQVHVTGQGTNLPNDDLRLLAGASLPPVGASSPHASNLELAFCREAITAQGGQTGFETQPGEWTRFWFTLPASPLEAVD